MMTWELRQSYAVLLERQASDAAVTFVWNDSSTASVEKIKKDLRCIHARDPARSTTGSDPPLPA